MVVRDIRGFYCIGGSLRFFRGRSGPGVGRGVSRRSAPRFEQGLSDAGRVVGQGENGSAAAPLRQVLRPTRPPLVRQKSRFRWRGPEPPSSRDKRMIFVHQPAQFLPVAFDKSAFARKGKFRDTSVVAADKGFTGQPAFAGRLVNGSRMVLNAGVRQKEVRFGPERRERLYGSKRFVVGLFEALFACELHEIEAAENRPCADPASRR